MNTTEKQTGAAKTARNPIKIIPLQTRLRKPEWIRVKSGSGQGYHDVKRILREHKADEQAHLAGVIPISI